MFPWPAPRLNRRFRPPDSAALLWASGRWAAFLAVEAGAEVARRRMILAMPPSPLSTPTSALLAVTLWTYLAHTRYAFRLSPRTGLATLPPFLAAGLAAAVGRSLVSDLCAGAWAWVGWAAATAMKYLLVRAWAWPRANTEAAPG